MFDVPPSGSVASSKLAATSRAFSSEADSSLLSLLTMTISLRRRFLALQSFARAVAGERTDDCTVILTRHSDWQQPPWNGVAPARSEGPRGLFEAPSPDYSNA